MVVSLFRIIIVVGCVDAIAKAPAVAQVVVVISIGLDWSVVVGGRLRPVDAIAGWFGI